MGVTKTYDELGGGKNAYFMRVLGISGEIVRFHKNGRISHINIEITFANGSMLMLFVCSVCASRSNFGVGF